MAAPLSTCSLLFTKSSSEKLEEQKGISAPENFITGGTKKRQTRSHYLTENHCQRVTKPQLPTGSPVNLCEGFIWTFCILCSFYRKPSKPVSTASFCQTHCSPAAEPPSTLLCLTRSCRDYVLFCTTFNYINQAHHLITSKILLALKI